MRSLLVFVLIATAACDPQPPPNNGSPDPCPELDLGPRGLQQNLFGQLTGVSFPVQGSLGAATPERLRVELYDSTTFGVAAPLAPGSFGLGEAPNDQLATCQHCVWTPLDWDEVSPMERVLWATEGTLVLDQVTDPLEAVFSGSVQDVVLREATVDLEGALTLVDGGLCRKVAALAFDTTPTPGKDCLSAEDCGNALLEICDPASQTCTDFQCGEFFSCPLGNQLCMSQYGERLEGACYTACNPTLGGCEAGQSCVQLGVVPSEGVCKTLGTVPFGEACARSDTSTGCVDGGACSEASGTCTRTCSFFATDPGCDAGTVCSMFNVCEPPAAGVSASIGEACGEEAALAQGCAADSERFAGYCFTYGLDPLQCEEACMGSSGCEAGEFCALRFTSGLGICLPLPVCGDGERGEINEVCDDGNQKDRDGCKGDCSAVEYGPICNGAPALTPGAPQPGDTLSAWDGFQASCQLGLARAQVWTYTPPGPGRLRLWVESSSTQLVSVRGDCDAPSSEVGCVDNDIWGAAPELVLQITEPAPAALTVLVSAFTVLEEGPFVLNSEFVPELCGDGIAAGSEICDDGNTGSGDGCSGDCSTVEYGVYCDEAVVLNAGVDHHGDSSGAPRLYDSSCANWIYGSGPDVLHRLVAPATGQLRLLLEQPGLLEGGPDLALAVFTGCGAPPELSELACSSVYVLEEVVLDVTAGQALTVLVEGFGPDDAGPYVLTAEMLP